MKATMSKPEDLKNSFQKDTKLLLKLADYLHLQVHPLLINNTSFFLIFQVPASQKHN